MSNFICPHCQQIIDDGSDGFTSDREIELEKKLDIAVKALKIYANSKAPSGLYFCFNGTCRPVEIDYDAETAQQALKEIEVKEGKK